MGPYIVDFACLKVGLLIELDGGQHADQVEQDNRRTGWLESQGFRVLRFWNDEVLKQTDNVVEAILDRFGDHQPARRGCATSI